MEASIRSRSESDVGRMAMKTRQTVEVGSEGKVGMEVVSDKKKRGVRLRKKIKMNIENKYRMMQILK